ncbi:hypothetical protein [Stakelama saccharophila]|uniref:Uncharacterized protein n=1 Tax=Stakelama saccharophila TaxID=3075605 RepID=A0ABZ0BBN8_9SPHN|nr:hypothetical protein [Stakelama sp. W311]WNO54846.1 hypothetical protein RPR59_06270 [Stakelama sp. W311]
MRGLIETVHVLAGLGAPLLLGWLSAWSYPLGRQDIWLVTWAAMGVTLVMGIGPMRRAIRVDRRKLRKRNLNG